MKSTWRRQSDYELEYGHKKNDVPFFAFSVGVFRSRIKNYLTSENPEIRQAAGELEELLPKDLPEVKIFSLPTEEITEEEF